MNDGEEVARIEEEAAMLRLQLYTEVTEEPLVREVGTGPYQNYEKDLLGHPEMLLLSKQRRAFVKLKKPGWLKRQAKENEKINVALREDHNKMRRTLYVRLGSAECAESLRHHVIYGFGALGGVTPPVVFARVTLVLVLCRKGLPRDVARYVASFVRHPGPEPLQLRFDIEYRSYLVCDAPVNVPRRQFRSGHSYGSSTCLYGWIHDLQSPSEQQLNAYQLFVPGMYSAVGVFLLNGAELDEDTVDVVCRAYQDREPGGRIRQFNKLDAQAILDELQIQSLAKAD